MLVGVPIAGRFVPVSVLLLNGSGKDGCSLLQCVSLLPG